MIRPAALLLIACLALYSATLDHYFASDDFLNLERSAFQTLSEGLRLFATDDVDFYRPIPRLHFGILWGLLGERTVGWNLAGVLLHALASIGAMVLARSLLGDGNRRAVRYTGLFFALHFIHVEAVTWASGITSVYVTLFLFGALHHFRRARATGSVRHSTLSVVAFFLALLSKETAVAFVPLLLFVGWWWPVRGDRDSPPSRWPTAREALPFVILLIGYLVIASSIDRGGAASPYRWSAGVHVLKNAAFFELGGFLPLRYWEVQSLWAAGPSGGLDGLVSFAGDVLRRPALGFSLVAGGAALGAAILRGGHDVRGGFLWILVAALPFLLLPGSGERFQYLSSFGACLVLGLGAQALLRRHRSLPGGTWGARGVVLAALALLIAGNLDRQADWAIAGRWTLGIRNRWGYFRALEPDQPIEFVGIPDEHRSAWVFRNGFDSMARLFWEGRLYRREGEMPPGSPPAKRMQVVLQPGGQVGMLPEGLREWP
jgi:hypothetical protein